MDFLLGMEDHLNHKKTGCSADGSLIKWANMSVNGSDWGNAMPLDTCVNVECDGNHARSEAL